MAVARADLVGSTSTFTLCIQQQGIWETREMVCYVLALGKQHLGPHVVVGYGIKFFSAGPFHYVTRSPVRGINILKQHIISQPRSQDLYPSLEAGTG